MRCILVFVAVSALCVVSTQSLRCYEGFNISIGGVPFYYGNETLCIEKSDCFSQELETKVFDTKLKVLARYSGCVSTAYSPLITCENLFGPTSKLDPAVLFNMLPDLEKQLENLITNFTRYLPDKLQALLSNGDGSESFIAGCFTFLEIVGFNMEKARPVQSQLANLFKLIFNPPRHSHYPWHYGLFDQYENTGNSSQFKIVDPHPEIEKMLQALKALDTENSDIAGHIYSFFSNFFREDRIKNFEGSVYASLMEKLPGLVKSILPKAWMADTWYDSIFEVLGNVNRTVPRKSTIDAINTMKKVIEIPSDYSKFFEPIFALAPDLVEQIYYGNSSYVGTWSLQLLKAESMTDDATMRLSAALEKLYAAVYPEKPYGDVHTFITWIPGLFYNLFEGKKAEIDNAYAIISEGIEAINFQNSSDTMKKTKMSEFIIMLTKETNFVYPMGPAEVESMSVQPTGLSSIEYELEGPKRIPFMEYGTISPEQNKKWRARNNLVIINLSRVIYNLLPDYETKLDAVYNALLKGYHDWPKFDSEKIVRSLIIDLGWKVPTEIEPILEHLNTVVDVSYNFDVNHFHIDKFLTETMKIVDKYDEKYPQSDMPRAIHQVLGLVYRVVTQMPSYLSCEMSYTPDNWEEYNRCLDKFFAQRTEFTFLVTEQSCNVTIDMLFAISKEMDYDNNSLFQNLFDSFPDFAVFIRLMRAMDASDVKVLVKDLFNWIYDSTWKPGAPADSTPSPLTTSNLVKALDASVARLTSKLRDVIKELRSLVAPDSCRFLACSDSLCNTRQELDLQDAVTRDPGARKFLHPPTKNPSTTTSGSKRINSFPMILIVLYAITKLV